MDDVQTGGMWIIGEVPSGSRRSRHGSGGSFGSSGGGGAGGGAAGTARKCGQDTLSNDTEAIALTGGTYDNKLVTYTGAADITLSATTPGQFYLTLKSDSTSRRDVTWSNSNIQGVPPTHVEGTDGLVIPIYYDGTDFRFTTFDGLVELVGDNMIVNPNHNTIDVASGIIIATIGGGGSSGSSNAIGRVAKPTLAFPGAYAEWIDDTDYPADGVAGRVATIAGGYDNINNQIAGTIGGGGHNYIRYNVNGHSVIAGGSFNTITGGRAFIGGGRYNVVTSVFGAINCGENNRVDGNNSGILAGSGNSALGGANSILGSNSQTSGVTSTSIGDGHLNTGDFATTQGRQASNDSNACMVLGGGQVSKLGDTQTMQVCNGVQTTNDTLTSVSTGFQFTDDDDYFGTGKVRIVGIDPATHEVVAFDEEFSFKMVAGVTTFYDSSGTSTAPGSTSETMSLTSIVDEIGVGTCQLRATSGTAASIITRVTGVASTTIKWTSEMQIVLTRID